MAVNDLLFGIQVPSKMLIALITCNVIVLGILCPKTLTDLCRLFIDVISTVVWRGPSASLKWIARGIRIYLRVLQSDRLTKVEEKDLGDECAVFWKFPLRSRSSCPSLASILICTLFFVYVDHAHEIQTLSFLRGSLLGAIATSFIWFAVALGKVLLYALVVCIPIGYLLAGCFVASLSAPRCIREVNQSPTRLCLLCSSATLFITHWVRQMFFALLRPSAQTFGSLSRSLHFLSKRLAIIAKRKQAGRSSNYSFDDRLDWHWNPLAIVCATCGLGFSQHNSRLDSPLFRA